jgi:hypothetical protein
MNMHDETMVETYVINGLLSEMDRDLTLTDRFSERVGNEVIIYDMIMTFRVL